MTNNLLGNDPLVVDTYYPHDFEGMLARIVRVDRMSVEQNVPSPRRSRLRSRMPIAVAIASLAGASLAGGLAAASSGGGHAQSGAHDVRVAPARESGSVLHWTPAGPGSTPPAGAVSGPPHWSPAGPGSTAPSNPSGSG
jgi:hypothetical protein